MAARFNATVERHPTEAVLAEVEAVADAAEAAQKEADRVLRQRKRAETHAKMTDRIDAIKDKLSRHCISSRLVTAEGYRHR